MRRAFFRAVSLLEETEGEIRHVVRRAPCLLYRHRRRFARPANADEGMWTFDAFPAAKMRAAYGWAPDQAWLDGSAPRRCA